MIHRAFPVRSSDRSRFERNHFSVLIGVAMLIVTLFMFIPHFAHASIANWQRGITMYPAAAGDFGSANFDQTIQHMQSLGFNYVTLVIPHYQSSIYSTDIQPAWNTPSDSDLVHAIQVAHQRGMHVVLSVYLDPGDGNWRANINPSDRSAWFANYKNVLMKYAGLAQQNGVEQYTLGTELISMTSQNINSGNTQAWQDMIGAVRSAYSGKLVYDANWGSGSFANEPPQIGFWNALDFIGISAYYELDGDGSVASLKNSWSSWENSTIAPLHQQYGKPILFSEVGYRSVQGAHAQPWNSGFSGAYSSQEQINAYTALFEYWGNSSYMNGISIWYGLANPQAGGEGNTDYVIQNKPVEQTIQQWFGGGTQTPPTQPPPTQTPPSAGSLDIWWPVDGATVSGVQPIKAMLQNLSVSQYSAYWQVDGDQLNSMYDSAVDYPHKENYIDYTGWNWRGNGPYVITVVAKDGSGNVLGQKSSTIHVYR